MELEKLTPSQKRERNREYIQAIQLYHESLVKYSKFLYDEDLELEDRKMESQFQNNEI